MSTLTQQLTNAQKTAKNPLIKKGYSIFWVYNKPYVLLRLLYNKHSTQITEYMCFLVGETDLLDHGAKNPVNRSCSCASDLEIECGAGVGECNGVCWQRAG